MGRRLPAAAGAEVAFPCDRLPHSVTFVRRVHTPFVDGMHRFDRWWRLAARDGAVDVGGSRLVGPPLLVLGEEGRRLQVSLGRGSVHPAVPMELSLSRWSASFGTTLELVPRRRLHATDRYFQEGHLLLDRIISVLAG